MLDHRTNGYLGIREQFLDGIGQQMGGGVANHLQTVCVLGRHDGQQAVLCDLKAGINHLAIDLSRQRGLGQTGADRGGDLGHSDRAGKLAL
ncbi:hypothetical protein D9M68_766560 [compost metagenome]